MAAAVGLSGLLVAGCTSSHPANRRASARATSSTAAGPGRSSATASPPPSTTAVSTSTTVPPAGAGSSVGGTAGGSTAGGGAGSSTSIPPAAGSGSAPTFQSATASVAAQQVTLTYDAQILCSSVNPRDFGLEIGAPSSSGGGRPVPVVATGAACQPAGTSSSTVVLRLPARALQAGALVDVVAGQGGSGGTVTSTSGAYQIAGNSIEATAH